MTCSRLRLATVTLDGIYHLHPYSWDGLFGYPGKRGENVPVIGRPGRFHTPDKEPEERVITLGLLIRPHDTAGAVTLSGGGCEHLELNQDEILGIIGRAPLQTLEWDMCDGTTRFLEVEFTDPAPIAHKARARELPLIGRAPYPGWRNTGAATVTVAPASVNPGGNAWVDDGVGVWTAAAILGNTTNGEAIEIDPGGAGAVTVDFLTGRITQGGVAAPNRFMGAATERLFRLEPGVSNTLTTSAGTVSVAHRPTWW